MTRLHKRWIEALDHMYLYINMICLSDSILKLIQRYNVLIHYIPLVHQYGDNRSLIIVNHMCPRQLLRQGQIWDVLVLSIVNIKTSTFITDLLLHIIRLIIILLLRKVRSTITILLLAIIFSII
ncbi:unnamed protein product [Musa textilis]